MAALIQFEWGRDSAGYRVETRTIPGFRTRRGFNALMPGPKPPNADEEIEIPAHTESEIIANGGPMVRYRPLEEEPSLFAILAATEPTPEGVKAFADKYGLLWHGDRTNPEVWREHIEAMRTYVDAIEERNFIGIAETFNSSRLRDQITVRFGSVHGQRRPSLYFEPTTLADALWLQVAQHVSGGHSLRRCNHCGTGFVFGSGTGRRRSGHYCSDRCRKAAWISEKEKGK